MTESFSSNPIDPLMPLIELAEKKPLSQRFTFLNISGQEATEAEDTRGSIGNETKSEVKIQGLGASHLSGGDEVLEEFFEASDLVAHSVVKTSMLSQKLFINLATLRADLYERHTVGQTLFSEITQSIDKSGKQCYVLTALVPRDGQPIDADVRVRGLLDLLRTTLDTDVSSKYSFPKMKKKGLLGRVRIPSNKRPSIEQIGDTSGDSRPRSLITEVAQERPVNTEAIQSGLKHKISPFSRAILATPFPTQYTHNVAIPLPSPAGVSCSRSVYFDSHDSTLKILVPPSEDFISVVAKSDDFRAFTKDGELMIFYVGA